MPETIVATAERGTITSLKIDRGFGFIRRRSGPDVFFHLRDLSEGLVFGEHLQELDVRFDVAEVALHRLQARNITPAR